MCRAHFTIISTSSQFIAQEYGMTKHLTGVPPVRTTHASSFRKIGDPEPGSWNRVCVKFQQLIRTFTQHARNALPLLCPDGAAGVAARDEAVQPRPLCEQHHQGGGRGSLLDLGRGGGRGHLLALEAARVEQSSLLPPHADSAAFLAAATRSCHCRVSFICAAAAR